MSKPAVLSALGVTRVWVAWMTIDMTTTVVMTIANNSMAMPVRKRALKG